MNSREAMMLVLAGWPASGPAGPRDLASAGRRKVGSTYQALACFTWAPGSRVKLTIPAAVDRAAEMFGGQPALAEPDGPRLSFAELQQRVRGISGAFVASGIEPGDRVAIWSPNTHHWVLGALGALYAGATLVPVSTRYTGPEALDIIDRSGARALLVADHFLGVDRLAALWAAGDAAAGDPLDRLSLIVSVPAGPQRPDAPDGGRPQPASWADFEQRGAGREHAAIERAAAVRPDQVSDILFTSGTTGRSKGAMSA